VRERTNMDNRSWTRGSAMTKKHYAACALSRFSGKTDSVFYPLAPVPDLAGGAAIFLFRLWPGSRHGWSRRWRATGHHRRAAAFLLVMGGYAACALSRFSGKTVSVFYPLAPVPDLAGGAAITDN
jgi:hypothetical protein